ncbi:MAG: hypothetical protein AAF962_19740 [Actinomycetota bacterium]
MTVAPRALVVSRPTEYDHLVARHGSRSQVEFVLSGRGRSLDELDRSHAHQQEALQMVAAAVPVDWRRASLDRADLDRWLFGPEDVVIAVGQDGLVANVAKYLSGQPVVGVDPEPTRNAGVLVRHRPDRVAAILRRVAAASAPDEPCTGTAELRSLVELATGDGRSLRALNEVYIGHPSHQSARYSLVLDRAAERQSSSGVLVGTATGATSWCRSVHRERRLDWALPETTSTDLAWFVREAWPSPSSGTDLTAGLLVDGAELVIESESDRLVAFGDGIESDRLEIGWGERLRIRRSARSLLLL